MIISILFWKKRLFKERRDSVLNYPAVKDFSRLLPEPLASIHVLVLRPHDVPK